MQRLILFIGISCFLYSCEKAPDYDAEDQAEIEQYIQDKGLSAQSTSNGLYYVIEEEGTGDRPTTNSNVSVYYKGYFSDGLIFDQTNGTDPATFSLQQVIEGWQEGIPLFKEGGKGILLIPSKLAYGNRSVGSIPPYSVLIFEIELLDVL